MHWIKWRPCVNSFRHCKPCMSNMSM